MNSEVPYNSENALNWFLTLLNLSLLQLAMSPRPWAVWIADDVDHLEFFFITLGPYGGCATPYLVCPELVMQSIEAT